MNEWVANDSCIKRVSVEVDEKADKFYAVARGKVVGIFTDYNEVKNHVREIFFCYYLNGMENSFPHFFRQEFQNSP